MVNFNSNGIIYTSSDILSDILYNENNVILHDENANILIISSNMDNWNYNHGFRDNELNVKIFESCIYCNDLIEF